MAIYSRKEKKLRRATSKKQQYQKYFKEMRAGNKQPMTQAHWMKSGQQPTYYKGASKTRPEAKLRRAQRKRMGMKD